MAIKKEIRRTGWRELSGIVMLVIAIIGLLSMFSYDPADVSGIQAPPNNPPVNLIGPVGAWFSFTLFMLLGVPAYLVPAFLGGLGLYFVLSRNERMASPAISLTALLVAVICLFELRPDFWGIAVAKLNVFKPGGFVGYLLVDQVFVRLMGVVGTTILALAVLIVSSFYLFQIHPIALAKQVGAFFARAYEKFEEWRNARRDKRELLDQEEKEIARKRRRLEQAVAGRSKTKRPAKPIPVEEDYEVDCEEEEGEEAGGEEEEEDVEEVEDFEEEEEPEPIVKKVARVARRAKKKPKLKKKPKQAPAEQIYSTFVLPSMELLDASPAPEKRAVKSDFQRTAKILQETLAEFGIEAEVTNVERGPVVTRYQVLPAPGIRVERIVSLSNNIGLAMKAQSVRIQAPIPGKGVVGIEVPNAKSTVVYLRDLLEGEDWQASEAALPLVLGKDVGGRDIIADLAEMPHMLIAGSTGSGKTVCMNSLLAGLLMSRTPDQLKLMLVDPKIVEFSAYNHLPHLVVPVITDPKKVVHGLRWAIHEMERRYKLFAKVGVRNIAGFNTRPVEKQADLFQEESEAPESSNQPPARLPYLVIVIDELADLMMVAQAEIENGIARLAQLSRAVGIHMIIATQRPSVNVITGTIKANLPARIAFQVAQKIDSRTILDANGADKLLGKGDMLFLPPGTGKLVRAQGTLTSDGEINRMVQFIKDQGAAQYETEIKQKIESKAPDLPDQGEDDELLETAVEIIRQTKRASTSSLQRRLRIGYTRAARLMDLLEERGFVGPPRGSDPREILIDLDGEIPQNESEVVGAE